MQNKLAVFLFAVVFVLVSLGQVAASGTPINLGATQELRLDLPLEQNKSYAISMEFRTDLHGAAVTMTLCGIGPNNEVVEFKTVSTKLDQAGNWLEVALGEVEIPSGPFRFELVLKANQHGVYYWQGLKVTRTYNMSPPPIALNQDYYTGLVVDARHLNLRRGISPRIYSEAGQLIYGGVLASQDLVQERGVVGYGSELTPELLTRLETEGNPPYVSPLIVQAVGVADAAKTGVYISAADTQRILEAMAKYDFFARYAVIFLVE